jgi:hypothetical protein
MFLALNVSFWAQDKALYFGILGKAGTTFCAWKNIGDAVLKGNVEHFLIFSTLCNFPRAYINDA